MNGPLLLDRPIKRQDGEDWYRGSKKNMRDQNGEIHGSYQAFAPKRSGPCMIVINDIRSKKEHGTYESRDHTDSMKRNPPLADHPETGQQKNAADGI